jgi:hypothetical protein
VGVPIYVVVGILLIFAPEVARALNATGEVSVSKALLFETIGVTTGCVAAGVFSQYFKTRKKALLVFLLGTVVTSAIMSLYDGISPDAYYILLMIASFFIGYWVLLLTVTAEMFGTNLRSTVTGTVPNFVRAAIIPMNMAIAWLKPDYGFLVAAQTAAGVFFILALAALWFLPET